jgi:tetratricopeptide (TPR) repeat protein
MLGGDTHLWDADSEPFELSLGEKFAVNQGVEERWKVCKQEGNESLKAGDYATAIQSFSDALSLATAPLDQIRTLKTVAASHPGAFSKVVKLVWPTIDAFLSKPMMWNVPDQYGELQSKPVWKTVPNMPAAMCLSNRAATYLERGEPGDYEKALKDGKEAAGRCPEYIKAHHRIMRALQKLGDKTGAKKKNVEVRQYTELCEMLPWNGPALYMIGWITGHTFEYLYNVVRFQYVVSKLRELGVQEVNFHLSLIGMQGEWVLSS